MSDNINKILITGSAGFIGSALSIKLLNLGYNITGVDNHSNYYDPELKESRLSRHNSHKNYSHHRIDIENTEAINSLFQENEFDIVINLAAQAGVRYSLVNPQKYINTNILGFCNILEACKNNKIKHLVYASSSSVYGLNKEIPFSTNHNTDHPASIYAVTKKSNELLAHTYSHLYNLSTTGLRFFTVYGPWDRPDMALQLFANSIIKNKPIKLFNHGKHRRDFTYIDDITEGITKVMSLPAQSNLQWNKDQYKASSSSAPYRIFNIGNNRMIKLKTYISLLEKELGIKAKKEMLPIQPGDIEDTYADVDDLIENFNYQPNTPVEIGIKNFVKWYLSYYETNV